MSKRIAGVALVLCATFAPLGVRAADTAPHVDTSGVNQQPPYPACALQARERGTVVLAVEVTKDGRVSAIHPFKTSGFNDLDSAASAGILGWHFVPATKGGQNTAGTTLVQIVFQPPAETGSTAATTPPVESASCPASHANASGENKQPTPLFDPASGVPPHVDTSGLNMQPAYPASALQSHERGAVALSVDVTKDGKVTAIRPVKTSGFNDLDSAAIAGAMGWHFIPANKDGQNIAGMTVIQIVFQPPDESGSAAASATAAPKPASDFLPPLFDLNAPRGMYAEEVRSIPCPNGKIQATLEFVRPNGPAESHWLPVSSLTVQTHKGDKGWVALFVTGRQGYIPPQEFFELNGSQGKGDVARQRYEYGLTLGTPETLSLSWDPSGTIRGTVGNMESRTYRLVSPPTELSFSTSSGNAKFVDPQVTCLPSPSASN